MNTVLFDLDGTIANIDHRRVYLQKDVPDWKSFNDELHNDTPNEPIVELYKALWETKRFDIIIVTGRMEGARKITEEWLKHNGIPFKLLIMRLDKDFRPDHEIKKEILTKLRAENRNIIFSVDDRQQVVNMWRSNGVTCLQCDEGDF
jgi:FMN phosphatase YigB (HAD superfamily)